MLYELVRLTFSKLIPSLWLRGECFCIAGVCMFEQQAWRDAREALLLQILRHLAC